MTLRRMILAAFSLPRKQREELGWAVLAEKRQREKVAADKGCSGPADDEEREALRLGRVA